MRAQLRRRRRLRLREQPTGDRARPRAGGCSTRATCDELAAEPALTLLCGRYEGFDERIVEHLASESISIGRYVLAGGELAAMVLCDAVLRKLPGALGHERLGGRGVLQRGAWTVSPEYPHYTRPAEYRGWRVPEMLLSGHHERIRRVARCEQGASGSARRRVRPSRRGAADGQWDGGGRVGDGGPGSVATIRGARSAPVRSDFRVTRRLSFSAMSTVIESIERAQLRRVPDFAPGDRVQASTSR